ncbi:MAG: DUF2336 domain-containing protein [Alphaproteobacteria bacterium]|nr:DUF2336 domain-containing protein [Alphaproteobacteria bacterium]
MDISVRKELPDLFDLARDHSENGKLALCKKIAGIFFSPTASLTEHEQSLVNQLIEDLLREGTMSVRQALITEFSNSISTPRPVARQIAHGPIEIARPVLVANINLLDEDLIEIIKNETTDHAAAIAARSQINEAVADALVMTGDLGVMQIVAENMGAKLSGKAIEVLVDAARLASFLQKPIMQRAELNPDSAIRLFWWVSKELRRTTLERFGFGPGKLSAALNKATEDVLSALHLQKEDDDAMRSLADWLQERNALSTSLLTPLLRMAHYRLFNIVLSRLSHIDLYYIDMINSDAANGRMMVVLCRALGIDKGNFVSIFLMARGARKDDQIVHPRELSQVLESYDKLSPDMAKALIDSWKMDPSSITQHAERMMARA